MIIFFFQTYYNMSACVCQYVIFIYESILCEMAVKNMVHGATRYVRLTLHLWTANHYPKAVFAAPMSVMEQQTMQLPSIRRRRRKSVNCRRNTKVYANSNHCVVVSKRHLCPLWRFVRRRSFHQRIYNVFSGMMFLCKYT